MFKPHYGTCIDCKRDNVIIVVKKGYCGFCNEKQKKAKKVSEGKVMKEYAYKRKTTGEMALFQAIWKVRPHICSVCGKALPEPLKPHYFAHILSKGAYPGFRLLDRNIDLMCERDHNEYDSGDCTAPKFDKINEKKQLLKELYYNTETLRRPLP